jgi:hypothetical protein
MTPEQALSLLTHPEEWPHGDQLPVIRRSGNPVFNRKYAGVVMNDNLCLVWAGIYLGDSILDAIPVKYRSPEELLSEWEID